MKDETGSRLAEALVEAERTRENLINCPPEEKGVRGDEYVDAQNGRNEALQDARTERAGIEAPPTPDAPGDNKASAVTASGDPLLAPPGVVVDHANLERYGALVQFRSKENPELVVEATPYAFDAGTAIATAEGEVATEQPTRVIRTETLGLVTEDVFHQAYERVTDTPEQAPVSDPVSPGGPQEPPTVAQAGAEDPPAEPAAEEASDPPPSA